MKYKNKLQIILTILVYLTLIQQNYSETKAIYLHTGSKTVDSNKFLGNWYMQTVVVSSSCPFIIPGTTTESTLQIKSLKSINKTIKTIWSGGKWTKTNGKLKLLNDKEAVTERVTNIKTKDKNLWKSILIDHLKYVDKDKIELDSIVLQYKNYKFIGEYRTHSILTKNTETQK